MQNNDNKNFIKLIAVAAIILIAALSFDFYNSHKNKFITYPKDNLKIEKKFRIKSEYKTIQKTDTDKVIETKNEYISYLEKILTQKWKNIQKDGTGKLIDSFILVLDQSGKIKGIYCNFDGNEHGKRAKIIERLVRNMEPFKPLPKDFNGEDGVFNLSFYDNGLVYVKTYKKVTASQAQIEHQKEINAYRKKQGFPAFEVRDYIYTLE